MLALIASGVASLFLDQVSKRAIEASLGRESLRYPFGVTIRRTTTARRWYRGRYSRPAFVIMWLSAVACAFTLHAVSDSFETTVSRVAIGAAFGGAAGNLVDIFRSQAVVDFIDLHWWPAFNLADVAIVAGLCVALLS